MTNSRDDMVIRVRLKKPPGSRVQKKAVEDRRVEGAKKEVRKSESLFQRLRRARQAMTRKVRAPKISKSKFSSFTKAASKRVGWMFAVTEAAITAGQVARAAGGASQRLVEAQDQDDLWFDLDEKATALRESRGFVESDRDLLRIIGKEGKVNNQIASIADDMRKMAFTKAVGDNLIEIDPAFDSRDTLQDQMIHIIKDEAAKANLKQKADEAMEMINAWIMRARSGR